MPIDVTDYPNAERPAVPAATVVLLRDGAEGIEVLMIHRSSKTAFGGMWAFPGGVIEDDDIPPGTEPDPLPAARRAAIRESREEVGLMIGEDSLVYLSHWLPPKEAPRRFSTWFFVAASHEDHGDVGIDGTEVHDHRWMRPQDTLAALDRGEVEMAPPTIITLDDLRKFTHVDEALAAVRAAQPRSYATEMGFLSSGTRVCLWAGDASYRTGSVEESGARHRLIMEPGVWTYVDDSRR